eukprot:gb/GFBE01058265.1/.p1 GENE.gb/GFBE01058265.1/~~gb/GFBE01058265.1/.p1  ORF type:complete len:440 (+),score=122.49 gb/GFBE01058265.1/:1-1320(+)
MSKRLRGCSWRKPARSCLRLARVADISSRCSIVFNRPAGSHSLPFALANSAFQRRPRLGIESPCRLHFAHRCFPAAMAAVGGRSLLAASAALCLTSADAQFGGGGGFGGFGGAPAPICPAFRCPKGETAVGKPETQIVSFGCKDSGMNIMSMGRDFDPNNPYASMNQAGKNLNKCCIERDICKQTCGMSSTDCHDTFQKCQTKVCKGDQNCQLQAMIADIASDPFENPDDKSSYTDPAKSKCNSYDNGQKAACQCVAKDEVKTANEKKLKEFYSKFNPEKLDANGDIKDVDEVWKKWKGKEPAMFMALAHKYKEKAVTIKPKPKPSYPPPPRPKDDEADAEAETDAASDAEATPAESVPEPAADAEGEAFEKELQELLAKKEAAKKEEDFDLADEMKLKAADLKAKEVKRLKAAKAKALDDEDYIQAKTIKSRIEKLEL